ncbi:DUF4440 domain-containing protein [Luteimicrobium sp. NPDC057192]|uniref:nuclear transport factor 2 family protein n=1 Tax=Luteimicrobium sp. NPDC057192 TaxID=3346042 RepID=UPI00362CB3BE
MDVVAELRAREVIFHRSPPGSGRAVLEAIAAPDYWEVGASGAVYARNDVLDVVAARYAAGVGHDEPWHVRDFAVQRLSDDTWLATYGLDQGDRITRRATIWTRHGDDWVARYHQGTLVRDVSPEVMPPA